MNLLTQISRGDNSNMFFERHVLAKHFASNFSLELLWPHILRDQKPALKAHAYKVCAKNLLHIVQPCKFIFCLSLSHIMRRVISVVHEARSKKRKSP